MSKHPKSNVIENLFLKGWHPYAWIGAVILLLYFQSLFFDFAYYDDEKLIVNNLQFLTRLSNIPQAFTQLVFPNKSSAPYYRPMLTVSFMLDAQLSGPSPFVYHLTNVILHLLSCCLLYLFLTLLQYRKNLSLFFSLLFAVHPILTQAVVWIPGRNDSLLTVFILMAFIFSRHFIETRKWGYYVGYLLSYTLAIFSKESSFFFIVIIVFYILFIKREKITAFSIKALSAGWLMIVIVWFLARDTALNEFPAKLTIFDISISVLRNLHQFIIYLGKMILPFNLSLFPNPEDLGVSLIYGFIALILLVIAFCLTKHKRFNFIVLGLSWFILFLLPSLINPNISKLTIFALEHRVYLPMVGFIIILLEMDIIRNIHFQKKYSLIAVVILIGILFGMTFSRAPAYKNRIVLWETAVKESPNGGSFHECLAGIYYSDGIFDKSEIEYKKALELDPNVQQARYFLGLIYLKKNMYPEAIENLKKQSFMTPGNEQIYFNLGIAYYQQSKLEEMQLNSFMAEAKELTTQNKSKEAMAKLEKIKNNFKEAKVAWLKTLQLNPQTETAHNNLGLVYMDEQNYKDAEQEFKQEVAINPHCDKALFNLGMLRHRQNNLKEAEEFWQKTIRVNPDNLGAYFQLVRYYYEQKDYIQSKYYVDQVKRRGVQPPTEFLKHLEEKLQGK
jgi:tetratricopeptide (TPR) repeat protein